MGRTVQFVFGTIVEVSITTINEIEQNYMPWRKFDPDHLVRQQYKCVFSLIESSWAIHAMQNLQEPRDLGGDVGDVIDIPLSLVHGHTS